MEGTSSNDTTAAVGDNTASNANTQSTAAGSAPSSPSITAVDANSSTAAAGSSSTTAAGSSSTAAAGANSPTTAAVSSSSCTPPTSSSTAVSTSHGADPMLLSQLLEMGVASNLAIRALLLSGNSSVEAAFTWLSELSPEEADVLACKPVEDDSHEWEDLEDEAAEDRGHKMVLVVDTTLGMKPGKMAAQVGHAVLGLYRVLKRNATRHRTSLAKWETYGEKMVVVRGSGIEQLRELRKQADLQRLPAYTVADAGLTQISPGSQTVLAIFGPVADVDNITGGLRLL